MKAMVKSILEKMGVYSRLKYSPLFHLYCRIFKPSVIEEEKRELELYRSFLSPCDLIFDIGANDGHKTAAFLHFSRKVVCVEPEPANVAILRTRFRKDREKVFIEDVPVTAHGDTEVLYIHQPGSAFNTLSPKFKKLCEEESLQRFKEEVVFSTELQLQSKTLDTLIGQYGLPHFIKVDTEGYELEVISGLSHPVPFISLEFMLPQFRSELEAAMNRLQNLPGANTDFNLAIHEVLAFPNFVSRDSILSFIDSGKPEVIELIARNREGIS